MSTDAFAAALGKGAAMGKPRLHQALRAGLIFGGIEGLTPVVGWLLGRAAASSSYLQAWDHWIAFGLLVVLGVQMIWSSTRTEAATTRDERRQPGILNLALTGIATSIDAAAVGVGLAFVDASITAVAIVIGLCTFTMVTLGIMLGHALGALIGRRAELLGGVVLIGVGAMILYEHLLA